MVPRFNTVFGSVFWLVLELRAKFEGCRGYMPQIIHSLDLGTGVAVPQ